MKATMAWRCRAFDGFDYHGERNSPDHVDDVPVVKPNQHDDVPVVEDTDEPEDETVPASVYEDIDSLFRVGLLLFEHCCLETAHALVEKKWKAKDKYYGKLIMDLGNEVHSSVEQGMNAEEKAECKKLKKELEEARIMPPKSAPLTQAAIRRMINESVDVAIAAKGQDVAPAVHECTFVGFMKCRPTVFHEGKKVKFVAATLQGPTLTWLNAKVATLGLETVNQMPWTEMKQLMTVEFCLIEEVQRMEHKLWNLKGEITSSKPTNLNEVVRMAHKLMEQKSQARDERILEGKKRKWESFQSGNSSGHTRNRCPRKVKQDETREVRGRAYAIKDAKPQVNLIFEIDLMPIGLGTFDIIIGMDWLVKHDVVIVYGDKVVRIPYRNKTLIIESDKGVSRLKVIYCIKARKYVERGCHLFLAHVTEKKSKEKRLEDVPAIRDFPEVFPDDLPGLPLPRQVEFWIDLVPGTAPVSRAPYRLAPSEMRELSIQLQELLEKGFICSSSSP
ncbi:putative reverse transcriptase domain-containing protein [Tanacetum coccineum]|uniref:Reverse transcriptase domain-containing protein n=1 Tax=Tanacetum coccineum TaxID=301880 RepID=A0ABQ5AU81_9ASTR